jgi:hypothetical protein
MAAAQSGTKFDTPALSNFDHRTVAAKSEAPVIASTLDSSIEVVSEDPVVPVKDESGEDSELSDEDVLESDEEEVEELVEEHKQHADTAAAQINEDVEEESREKNSESQVEAAQNQVGDDDAPVLNATATDEALPSSPPPSDAGQAGQCESNNEEASPVVGEKKDSTSDVMTDPAETQAASAAGEDSQMIAADNGLDVAV